MNDDARKVYGVAEITRLIKAALEDSFGNVWIEGEVSNLRRPSSGHFYFTLKDASAQISAVMFRGSQKALNFQPADGLLVRAFGQISVYERSGNYQIIVRMLEEAGKGSLQAAFEALKKKLFEEGLFDDERKRPIPLLPQHIGVVTSPTGAAIRDILEVVRRRFPNLHILIAPAKVQGEGAAEEIAAAIELLNKRGGLDVLIVGRGGGSLENLWCFNEETVARAIAASRIPVISAVGHEIDFAISDFVADMRAPTPSAAAEQVVDRKEALAERIAAARRGLVRSLREQVLASRNRLLSASKSSAFVEPDNIVKREHLHLNEMWLRVQHACGDRLRQVQQLLDDSGLRMLHAVRSETDGRGQDIRRLQAQLRALNPEDVLVRGYSITLDGRGHVVRKTADVAKGDRIVTRLAEGELESDVTAVKPRRK